MATYKRNFIEQVVFNVNFDSISLSKFNDFNEKIIEKKFELERTPNETTEENFEFGSDWSMKRSLWKKFIWKAQLWDWYIIELSDNYIQLFFNRWEAVYKDKSIFQKYLDVLDVFFDTFEIKWFSRVSLRYINNIKEKELESELSDYIQWDLLKWSDFSKWIWDLARFMSQFMIVKDGYNVMVKYWFWNNLFPSKIVDEDFILDIECSPSMPISRQEKSITEIFSDFNVEIDDIFERSITQEMKTFLDK